MLFHGNAFFGGAVDGQRSDIVATTISGSQQRFDGAFTGGTDIGGF